MFKFRASSLLIRLAYLALTWMIVAQVIGALWPSTALTLGKISALLGLPVHLTVFSTLVLITLIVGMQRHHRWAVAVYLVIFPLTGLATGVAVIFLYPRELPEDQETWLWWGPVNTAVSLAIIALVACAWKAFSARAQVSWKRSVLILLAGAICTFVFVSYFLVGVHEQPASFSLVHAGFTALGLDTGADYRADELVIPTYVQVGGDLILMTSALAALWILLRYPPRTGLTAAEHLDVRRLLLSPPSQDSLGYFATRDDRSIVYSPDNRAAVSYRVLKGVCLAAGDPLGEKDSWPEAITQWRALAHRNGWIAGVASCSEEGARAYATVAEMKIIDIGDEATIETDSFRLFSLPDVKRALAPAKNAGYTVQIRRQGSIDDAELAHIAECSAQWRNGAERGFSMASSRIADPRDRRTVVVTTHDPNGELQAVLTFVPWGRDGLSLDVMRRNPQAVGGVNELMISTLASTAEDLGVKRLSLNFVPLRDLLARGEEISASPWQKFLFWAIVRSARFWQISTLYASNLKYRPTWQSRYLAVERRSDMLLVLNAFLDAEGFLPSVQTPPPPTGDAEAIRELENSLLNAAPPEPTYTQQEQVRRAKIAQLPGAQAYPPAVPRTHSLADAPSTRSRISTTGRVRTLRYHGAVLFADLYDAAAELQLLAEGALAKELHRCVDRGDLISVTGVMGASRNGTPSLLVESWAMAAKALTPPPPPGTAMNPHLRAKLRHLDLATNAQANATIRARSQAIAAMRRVLGEHGFLETETPILQTVHGGANARPFRTHIRAYNQDLTLRIAPELYLKRMVIGGFEKVYEIGRNFRNEGVDATHNPEFTALEAYEAYGDWDSMRLLAEQIIREAAIAVHGKAEITAPDGTVVDLSQSWPVVPVYEAVSRAAGAPLSPDTPLDTAREIARAAGLPAGAVNDLTTTGDIALAIYDELVEPTTVAPVFYAGFPTETSPLAMSDPTEPRIAQRWDLVACGMELGTAYTELADPIEQRRRLSEQSLRAAGGDPEAMELDENFIKALEFGMPPTGGLGIGVDRVVMLLTGENIREVLPFPFVKPD